MKNAKVLKAVFLNFDYMYDLKVWRPERIDEDSRLITNYVLEYMPFDKVYYDKIETDSLKIRVPYTKPDYGVDILKVMDSVRVKLKYGQRPKNLVIIDNPLLNYADCDDGMGYHFINGGAHVFLSIGVSSLFAMENKKIERGANMALHELGEVFCLDHCDDNTCFMNPIKLEEYPFSQNSLEKYNRRLDNSNRFCDRCQEILDDRFN